MSIRHRQRGQRVYRSRRGLAMGVCRGLADYFDVNVFWVRVGLVALICCTGLWPGLFGYIVAGLVLKREPVIPPASDDQAEFYHCYSESRTMAVHRLRRTFEDLKRRIERIESMVTSKRYDWERRLHKS